MLSTSRGGSGPTPWVRLQINSPAGCASNGKRIVENDLEPKDEISSLTPLAMILAGTTLTLQRSTTGGKAYAAIASADPWRGWFRSGDDQGVLGTGATNRVDRSPQI